MAYHFPPTFKYPNNPAPPGPCILPQASKEPTFVVDAWVKKSTVESPGAGATQEETTGGLHKGLFAATWFLDLPLFTVIILQRAF